MATYVVTGVSRGIGYALLRLISQDARNTVIGIVRDKPATAKKVSEDPDLKGRSNIRLLEADITNYDALKKAAADTAEITGGGLDYLIANAGYMSLFDPWYPPGVLGTKPEELEDELKKLFNINVVGNVHLYNLFIPLILRGQAKKVVALTSGFADVDFTNQLDLSTSALYSISKAGLNMATAKFSAQYKKDGVLFLGISPGMVETGLAKDATPEQVEGFGKTVAKFFVSNPNFAGPDTPEDAARAVKSVWEKASIEKGDGGAFLSHFGNKQWV